MLWRGSVAWSSGVGFSIILFLPWHLPSLVKSGCSSPPQFAPGDLTSTVKAIQPNSSKSLFRWWVLSKHTYLIYMKLFTYLYSRASLSILEHELLISCWNFVTLPLVHTKHCCYIDLTSWSYTGCVFKSISSLNWLFSFLLSSCVC